MEGISKGATEGCKDRVLFRVLISNDRRGQASVKRGALHLPKSDDELWAVSVRVSWLGSPAEPSPDAACKRQPLSHPAPDGKNMRPLSSREKHGI